MTLLRPMTAPPDERPAPQPSPAPAAAPATTSDDGVLLIAHTRPSYWPEVATLCRSIRRASPDVRIALATDLAIDPRESRAAGFTEIVQADFRDFGGVSCKVRMFELSPFAGRTLFIDSDSICYRDISGVFQAHARNPFVTLGKTVPSSYWFRDSDVVKRRYEIAEFPFFIGAFYLFDRSPVVESIFSLATNIVRGHRDLGIRTIGGWCNDEPAFSIAMATHGLRAVDDHGDWIAHLHAPGLSVTRIDYASRTAAVVIDGRETQPAIVHYGAFRTQPLYCREKFLVNHPGTFGTATGAVASAVGLVESVVERAGRRVRRLLGTSPGSVGFDHP